MVGIWLEPLTNKNGDKRKHSRVKAFQKSFYTPESIDFGFRPSVCAISFYMLNVEKEKKIERERERA